MVPVLGRVASGMLQFARAELQQDMDSPRSDASAKCLAVRGVEKHRVFFEASPSWAKS